MSRVLVLTAVQPASSDNSCRGKKSYLGPIPGRDVIWDLLQSKHVGRSQAQIILARVRRLKGVWVLSSVNV